MASLADVVMIRDVSSSSSSNNNNNSNSSIQHRILSSEYLCDRVRMQDSVCEKTGCNVYGATVSAAATTLDSPTRSTDPLITFSEQEDDILRELVKRHGTKKCELMAYDISQNAQKDISRVQEELNKSSWSAEEDHLLLRGHNAFGNRWTEIAKMVPGRTDNAVKNQCNALCTKRSHCAMKVGDGFSSFTRIKYHLVESWNDASSFQHEPELKRARRVAQEEEESFFQVLFPSHLI